MDRLLSKEELVGLLGNCILALAIYKGNDPDLIREARDAAEDHVEELNRRFPGWKEELHQS